MWFKIAIVINLLLIVISLLSGAVFLAKGKGNSKNLLGALTVRITLSVILVVMLVIGFYTGQIRPHGI